MIRLHVLVLAAVLCAPCAFAADPFYENLHEEGVSAFARGDAERAVKVLRLACFGLLEEPPVLARCLVRLAVAQGDLGRREAFRETFERVVVVEQRLHGYTDSELGGELVQRFEDHVVDNVPRDQLLRLEGFRHIALGRGAAAPDG